MSSTLSHGMATDDGSADDVRPASSRTAGKARTRLNDRLALPLLAIVFFAAIPFGSNRPLFWALWASVLGLVSTIYFISIRLNRTGLFCPPDKMRFLAAPFLLVALFICFQIAPIGPVFAFLGLDATGAGPHGADYFSLTPGNSWLALCRWFSYGLLFFLIVQMTARSRRRLFLAKGLFVIIALEALYALAALTQLGDTILFFDKWAYKGVATGTFVNRNSLATYLALGLVIGAAYLFADKPSGPRRRSGSRRDKTSAMDPSERIFWAVGCLAIFAALLSTQSRMGMAAAFAGVATTFLLPGRASPVSRRALALIVLSAIAAIAYFGFGFDRYLLVERSAQTRIDLYRQVFGMILERPFTGFGAGSFEYAYPLFHVPPVSTAFVWERAHSTYLQLWSELGLVVGSLPVLMVVSLLVVVWRKRRSNDGPKPEQLALVGATVCVGVHSLVDFSLEMEAVAFVFVAILAIGSGELLGKPRARNTDSRSLP